MKKLKLLTLTAALASLSANAAIDTQSGNTVQVGKFNKTKSVPLQRDLVIQLKSLKSAKIKAWDDLDNARKVFDKCNDKFNASEIDQARYSKCSILATQKVNRAIDKHAAGLVVINKNLDKITKNIESENTSLVTDAQNYENDIVESKKRLDALHETGVNFLNHLTALAESNPDAKVSFEIENQYRDITDEYNYNQNILHRKNQTLKTIKKAQAKNASSITGLHQLSYELSRNVKLLGYRQDENNEYIKMVNKFGAIQTSAITTNEVWGILHGEGGPMPLFKPLAVKDDAFETSDTSPEIINRSSQLTIKEMIAGMSQIAGDKR